jgi:hypothetical protein
MNLKPDIYLRNASSMGWFCSRCGEKSSRDIHDIEHLASCDYASTVHGVRIKKSEVQVADKVTSKEDMDALRLRVAVTTLVDFRSAVSCGIIFEAAMDTIIELLGTDDDKARARRQA